jgi:hypothetical protein
MSENIAILPPNIKQSFNRDLLSYPSLGMTPEKLIEIFNCIIKKYKRKIKHQGNIQKFESKEKEFIELYERIKKKKENPESKTRNKTERPFYSIEFTNRGKQKLFDRLRFKR